MVPSGRTPPIWLQAAGLLLAAGAAGVWLGRSEVVIPPAAAPPVTVGGLDQPETLTVHVAGWVAVPGLVELEAGARVADAVAAAGGLLPGAAVEQLNLAAPVRDGDQVVVPGPGDGTAPPGGTPPGQGGPLRLNQASAQDLEALPGVGPVLAERIVAYRDEHGPFRALEDLLDVPGIGESKLASLRDLVVP
jgi:competence protein ComEA